ncbi:glycosyl hydrolase family 5 [Leptospira perolatii]|uniref:Glycosyl hydrolase family 5 n=1 Tax=Leptospira perolatii TaxID=2023191 RepID=A0A2M9ZIA6_9LEPT|nr:ricin-type beta-trefoil lectin domain protein [Leptospira perolatii]PJZ68120.1 glycosyl hydrolase family 5 [Leptospira perolatii]PJZ71741.1 glycosyl hydrolase family 5 [Leptospira perolatii]
MLKVRKLVSGCFILVLFLINCGSDKSKDSQGFASLLNLFSDSRSVPNTHGNRAASGNWEVGNVVLPATPLSTNGRYIVDANNNRFKMKAVNWWGASDSKQVVAGLDKQHISVIISLIKEWGFNAIRLPFSNIMLHNESPVSAEYISANPQWIGLTPLQVYDQTVQSLTDAGIVVVLNNHTTFPEWCCGFDYNGLWYHTGSSFAYNQTVEMWQNDWIMMINRYKNNKMVAAADLRNEVRTMRLNDTHLPESPNWGSGDKNDWAKASRDLGLMIMQNNSDIIVIIEGINWWGSVPILGSGERPHLRPVKDNSVHLQRSDKLVYAAHNYGFIGPNHNGDDNTSGGNIKYRQMDLATFKNTIYGEWGYVVDTENHYTAPVWVSEFGSSPSTTDDQEKEWLKRLVDYLIEKDLDFAYWPLNGNDEWGLLSSDWSRTLKDDWRFEHLNRLLQFNGKVGQVQAPALYASLSIGGRNDNLSASFNTDWDSGANKGTCHDGFRLNGLSRDHRALCTDSNYGKLWNDNHAYNVQAVNETPTRSHNTGDWASGFTKYECPANYYVSGYSKRSWGTSGILCAQAKVQLGNSCRTVWFDRGDNRTSTKGGDFANGSYKGQCGEDEYVAGVAQRDGNASALLCCSVTRYFNLKNRSSGLCADIPNGNTADGTSIVQWGCHSGSNQKWAYDSVSGTVKTRTDTSFCLDNNGQMNNGGSITLRKCNGGSNQQFNIQSDGTVQNRSNTNFVLDGFGTSQGSGIGTWTYHGGNNQKWDTIFD